MARAIDKKDPVIASPLYGSLMKKVEELIGGIGPAETMATTAHRIAQGVIQKLGSDLGFTGGRLYSREGNAFTLDATFPDAKSISEVISLSVEYAPVEMVLDQGTVFMEEGDRALDPEIEGRVGAKHFAAIEVGDGNEEAILAFDVAPGFEADQILYSLGILRHAINHKIRRERLEEVFREARRIQASILPRKAPEFGNFDIAGRTESLDIVGGDFYDYIPITEKIMGIAIADVSGHGLPAALQVRDVYTGLRMGLSRDFKIVRTVERLNDIINESTLTSRFVSMFYGELELGGAFIYVNCGHPGPFYLDDEGGVWSLEEGGAVLGPIRGATYERGFVVMKPGEMLVLYTDGIVEASCGDTGQEYGSGRLLRVISKHREEPAADIVDALFDDLERYCKAGTAASDDRTVVIIKRLP